MAADNILGSIQIVITGDTSELQADFQTAQSIAATAGNQIANALTAGLAPGMQRATGLVDQFGRAIQSSVTAPVQRAVPVLTELDRLLKQIAASENTAAASAQRLGSAHGAAVTQIQAVSGTIRTLEGNGGIRAAERALTLIPGLGAALQAAFPVVGFVAVAKIFTMIGEEAQKAFDKAVNAPHVIAAAFQELTQDAHTSNDQLQLTNDKLRDEIAKIEGHPSNGLKVALDEARVSADQLEQSLLRNLNSVQKLFLENKENPLESLNLLPGGGSDFSDIQQEAAKFQGQIQATINSYKVTSSAASGIQPPSIPGLDKVSGQLEQQEKQKESIQLAKQYSDEIDKLSTRLASASRRSIGNYSSEVASLTGLIELYKEQRAQIDLTGQKIGLDQKKAGLPDPSAYKKAEEAQKQSDETALATLQSQHQLTLAETASFWKSRLAAEQGYTDRVREIQITLGHIYQESDKAIMAGAQHGARILEEQARKAAEFTGKMAALAHEAEDIGNRIHEEDIKTNEQVGKIGAESDREKQDNSFVLQRIALAKEYGEVEGHTAEDQIEYQTKLAALNEDIAAAKITRDQADLAALDKDSQRVQYAQAELQLLKDQDALLQLQASDSAKISGLKERDSLRGQLQQQTSPSALAAPLADALAKGVLAGGRGIAKDIRESLKGIGQEILGTVLQHALTALIEKIGLETAIQALLHIGTVSQVAATTANTVVLTANTAASVVATAAMGVLTAALIANSVTNLIPGFAVGGRPIAGGLSVVGEQGPELFIPDSAGTIIPNGRFGSAATSPSLQSSAARSSGTNVNHFHINTPYPRETVRQIATYMKSQTPQFSPYSS